MNDRKFTLDGLKNLLIIMSQFSINICSTRRSSKKNTRLIEASEMLANFHKKEVDGTCVHVRQEIVKFMKFFCNRLTRAAVVHSVFFQNTVFAKAILK